jgi:hypothetical protein
MERMIRDIRLTFSVYEYDIGKLTKITRITTGIKIKDTKQKVQSETKKKERTITYSKRLIRI